MKSLRDLLVSNRKPIGPPEIIKVTPTDDQLLEQEPHLLGQSKKIQKFKREDYARSKLKHVGYPRKVDHTRSKSKRRFEVPVEYEVDGRVLKRHVQFGKEGKEEFVDHKNEIRRLNTISKLSNCDNFLHPNFYKAYLLNSKNETIGEAYKELVSTMELDSQPI